MKKKSVKKPNKSVRTPTKNKGLNWSWQRITVVISGIALFLVILTPLHRPVVNSVLGVSIVKGMYQESVVPLPKVSGAVKYNIYYKSSADSTFVNAVRNVNPRLVDYTITYLKMNTGYQYKISAVNNKGAEFWWSPTTNMTNLQSM